MASDADNLNPRERLRWGSPSKFYTRKRRRIQKNEPNPGARDSVAAVPEVTASDGGSGNNDNNDVLRPEQRLQHQEEAEPRLKESSLCNLEDGRDSEQVELINGGEFQEGTLGSPGGLNGRDGMGNEQVELINGGELQEGTSGSPANLNGRDATANGQLELINGGEVQEGTCAPPVCLDGKDVPECGGGGLIVEPNGGEVRDCSREGEPPVHAEPEAANGLVKPVISRVADRVWINLTGARSRDEISDLRRVLEGELDQIRSLVTKLEAKELQLTTHNASTNGGVNDVGRIRAFPGAAVNSYSYPHYMDNDVMKGRSLVRVNSEVDSVGHPETRPFQPPRIAVVENNNGAAEFVEKEKRTPKANQYYRDSEFLLGKDRLPPESNKKLKPNGVGRKHRSESEHGYAFSFGFGFDKHRNQMLKRCSNLLQRLMKHKHGWVFNEPVNVVALGLHDYHDIIKHPMDLGTIKTRLSQNWYKSPREFAEDVRLVFRNAITYNPKGHDVHVMAEELSEIFEEKWTVIDTEFNPDWRYQMYHDAGLPTPTSRKAPHPSPFPRASVTSHVAPPAPQVRTLDRSESMTGPADFRLKRSRVAHVGRIPVPKKPKRDMTYDEKQRLSTNLQNLPSEKLDAIVQIIKKRNSSLSQHDDEIEVDIDSVDAETLWELDRFVTNYKKN
uniref:Transcription factor GTE4 n=1 Tax=Nicotiana tabacum TaxID=4097 RepID=A0A1S4CNJ5_TOBAC|nr:PREDICTED: transcription factor GTE4-like [Nicotiana tabacum]